MEVYWDDGPGDAGLCALSPQGGMYWLVLLDDYSAGFGLMVVVITTCLVVTRVYGKGACPHRAQGRMCCLYEERDLEGAVGKPTASQWSMKLCSHHLFLLGYHLIHLSKDTLWC